MPELSDPFDAQVLRTCQEITAQPRYIVRNRALEIFLSDFHVRGRIVGGGKLLPDHHAVVAQVGDEQMDTIGGYGGRIEYSIRLGS